MLRAFALLCTLFLALANSGNDNIKGGASLYGSGTTNYISFGALFGIGTVSRTARGKTVAGIHVAWVTALPLAGVLGALCCLLLRRHIR